MDQNGSSVEAPPGTTVSHEDEVVVLRVKSLSARFWTATETRIGFPGNNPGGDMDLKRSDCDQWPPSYRIIKPRIAAYSCASGGNISYYVAKYGESGGVFFFARYPERDSENLKDIVSRMSASVSQVARIQERPK